MIRFILALVSVLVLSILSFGALAGEPCRCNDRRCTADHRAYDAQRASDERSAQAQRSADQRAFESQRAADERSAQAQYNADRRAYESQRSADQRAFESQRAADERAAYNYRRHDDCYRPSYYSSGCYDYRNRDSVRLEIGVGSFRFGLNAGRDNDRHRR